MTQDKLELVEFQVTSRCNLRCMFCADSIKNGKELELDLVKKVLDEVQPQAVSFTGGEPTLNKELINIIKWCSSKGLMTQINSNGLLVTPKVSKEFEEAGLSTWHFSRNYFSPTRAYFYQGTNKEDYNKIGYNIFWANKQKKDMDVNVQTTINITNISDLFNIHIWLAGMEETVNMHNVGIMMMSGKAKDGRFTIPPDMIYQVMNKFLAEKQDIFVKVDCLYLPKCSPYGDIWKYDGHNKVKFDVCKEGRSRIHIHQDGSIIICDQSWPMSETPIGNAYKDSVLDIYENNEIIKAWRAKPSFCCEKHGEDCQNICQGGVFRQQIYDYPNKPKWTHTGKGWEAFL